MRAEVSCSYQLIKCGVISTEAFSRLTVTEMNVGGSVKVLLKELYKICLANTVEGVFTLDVTVPTNRLIRWFQEMLVVYP